MRPSMGEVIASRRATPLSSSATPAFQSYESNLSLASTEDGFYEDGVDGDEAVDPLHEFSNLAALAVPQQTYPGEHLEKCPVPTCQYHVQGFEFWHECARHALHHYEALIPCEYCSSDAPLTDRLFLRADIFERHLLERHDPFFDRNVSDEYPCPICGDVALNAWDLAIHLTYCVIRKIEQQQQLHDVADLSQSIRSDLEAGNSLDDSKSANNNTPIVKQPSTGIAESTECGPEPQDPTGRRKHPAKWQCHLCPKRYTRAIALRAHMNNHNGVRPFQCKVCDLTFTRKYDCKTHESLHSGQRKYVCDTAGCGRQFSRATNLERHRRGHAKKEYFDHSKLALHDAPASHNGNAV